MATSKSKEYNIFAILGFICSFFIPILGIIFSAIALNQIKKDNSRGRGLAIAGLIIGIVSIVLIIIILIVYAALIFTLFSA